MSFHKRFASDVKAEQDGVRVDLGDGLAITVRSPKSAHSQATRKELEAEFLPLTKMGRDIPEKDQERLFTQLLAKSILIGWEGVSLPTGQKDADGKDIFETVPSNEEGFLRVLKDPVYSDFKADIVRVVTDRDTFRAAVREADVKN